MSDHPASLPIEKLLSECDTRRQRRSGPGGQHRNKVETAIFLVHRPTGIQAEASERRSQEDNRRMALFRLRVKLAIEVRGSLADAAPSPLWRERLRGTKIEINPNHADFPALLAEALDVFAHREFALAATADQLQTTGSQLVGLLSAEPLALAYLNQQRAEVGLGALRRR